MTPADYFKSQHRLHAGFDAQALGTLTEGLSLTPHLDKPLFMLSTGSKRKVWLAAAFAACAPVTLLDEPFAALDKASIGFVMELLADAAGQPARAWVIAHYEAPGNLPLAAIIDLGD
jgi:heme exporter protein A